jgi:hypothetical protein
MELPVGGSEYVYGIKKKRGLKIWKQEVIS